MKDFRYTNIRRLIQLLKNMTDTIRDSAVIKEVKRAVKADQLKRYNGEAEKNNLWIAVL